MEISVKPLNHFILVPSRSLLNLLNLIFVLPSAAAGRNIFFRYNTFITCATIFLFHIFIAKKDSTWTN